MTKVKIGGILQNDHLACINLNGVPGTSDTLSVLLSSFGNSHLNVQFISHVADHHRDEHIVLCVDRHDLEKALALVEDLQDQIRARSIVHYKEMATIGIFGPDFRVRPGIAGSFFTALADKKIEIMSISTSVSTCTVVISKATLPKAEAAIREAFELPST